MNSGYIKLWRKIIKSDMYQSLTAAQRDVMIQCLILANHAPKSWEWKEEIFTCQPGQFKTSLDTLRKHCAKDVSTKMIRTALKKLEKWGFLANEGAKQGRIITIINWDNYQKQEELTGKEMGRIGATTKNVKNVKNLEKWGFLANEGAKQGRIITIINRDNYQKQEELTGKEMGRIGAGSGQDRGRIGATTKNVKNVKNKEREKDIYGEFKNVKLTPEEHQKLIDRFGEKGTSERIEALSQYIASKGRRYKSHYATILSWEKRNGRNQNSQKFTPTGGIKPTPGKYAGIEISVEDC